MGALACKTRDPCCPGHCGLTQVGGVQVWCGDRSFFEQDALHGFEGF